MSINYELLRTFLDVGAAPTFTEAAKRRHVTPSAITQQIRTLEAQLEVQLFDRIGKRVRLNDAGRVLLCALEHHLPAIDTLLEDLVAAKQRVRGLVTFGSPRPFACFWLRPRLTELFAKYDELLVSVRFGGPSVLRRELIAGDCDFCILVEEPEHSALESQPIYVEEFVAIASPSYLERRGSPKTAEDFRQHRYIVFDDDLPMHKAFWRMAFGAREPLPKQIVARIANLDEMAALACAGVGVTVLPSYFAADCIASGRAVELVPQAAKPRDRPRRARNSIHLAWRKDAAVTPRFEAVRKTLLA